MSGPKPAALKVQQQQLESQRRKDAAEWQVQLLHHLYGEAGVLMSARARAAVHAARFACDEYLDVRRADRDEKLPSRR